MLCRSEKGSKIETRSSSRGSLVCQLRLTGSRCQDGIRYRRDSSPGREGGGRGGGGWTGLHSVTCERRAQEGLGRRSLRRQLSSGSGKASTRMTGSPKPELLFRGPSWGAGAPARPITAWGRPSGSMASVCTVRYAPHGSSPRGDPSRGRVSREGLRSVSPSRYGK